MSITGPIGTLIAVVWLQGQDIKAEIKEQAKAQAELRNQVTELSSEVRLGAQAAENRDGTITELRERLAELENRMRTQELRKGKK